MLKISLLVAILSAYFLPLRGFQIKIGTAETILQEFNLKALEEVYTSGLFVRRTLLFPYDVYEIPTRGSTIVEAKSFLLAKVDYELLADSFEMQNSSFSRVDEYLILYKKIPEAVLLLGETNQYMQFIRQDPSIYSPHFIIQNATYQNYRKEGTFTLNFYSLQLSKYLENTIRGAEKDMRSPLKQGKVKQILQNNQIYTQDKIESDEGLKNQFILQYFLAQPSPREGLYTSQLFSIEMVRLISRQALWAVKYDSFAINFVSAMLSQVKPSQQESRVQKQLFLNLEIVVSQQSEYKRVQHIKQPLKYMNLSTISYLSLCKSEEKLKLLLADHQNLFVIDITTHIWKFDIIKFHNNFSYLFFDQLCKPHKIINKTITQINGINKIQFEQEITSFSSLNNLFVVCFISNNCKVYLNNITKQIIQISLAGNYSNIDWQELILINESRVQYQLGYRQKWQHYQLSKIVSSVDIVNNEQNYTYFEYLIYPYEVYINKSWLRSIEMDKVFYHHLQFMKNHNFSNKYLSFHDFSQQIQQDSWKCFQVQSNEIQQKLIINPSGNWTVCPISILSNGLIQFKIIEQNISSAIYYCSSALENLSISPKIDCQIYSPTANKQKNYYILSNHMIKFYLLRDRQSKFPTFSFRDIEKQQLAFASDIFFLIMLLLSLSFFLIIIFIILRPITMALLIYYGWREELGAQTYPLGWFQLKIKIKKLVKGRYLKYVLHHPRNDEENHCCFCLQNLTKEAIVAQLYCLHEFHKDCFNQWMRNQPNSRCPTCRREFVQQDYDDFISNHNLIHN